MCVITKSCYDSKPCCPKFHRSTTSHTLKSNPNLSCKSSTSRSSSYYYTKKTLVHLLVIVIWSRIEENNYVIDKYPFRIEFSPRHQARPMVYFGREISK